VPSSSKAARAWRTYTADHLPTHIGLAHLPAHGVEAGLVIGLDLFDEGAYGMVGGGSDDAVEVEKWDERFAHHGVAAFEVKGAIDLAGELVVP
jgi:hypothetical protein